MNSILLYLKLHVTFAQHLITNNILINLNDTVCGSHCSGDTGQT